jgi:hypothetical protein
MLFGEQKKILLKLRKKFFRSTNLGLRKNSQSNPTSFDPPLNFTESNFKKIPLELWF